MYYKEWTLWHNVKQCLIAFDQLLRCLLALIVCFVNPHVKGYADETMSAFCHRQNSYWYVQILEVIVNVIMLPFEKFKWGHCERAYQSEIDRAHSPK